MGRKLFNTLHPMLGKGIFLPLAGGNLSGNLGLGLGNDSPAARLDLGGPLLFRDKILFYPTNYLPAGERWDIHADASWAATNLAPGIWHVTAGGDWRNILAFDTVNEGNPMIGGIGMYDGGIVSQGLNIFCEEHGVIWRDGRDGEVWARIDPRPYGNPPCFRFQVGTNVWRLGPSGFLAGDE